MARFIRLIAEDAGGYVHERVYRRIRQLILTGVLKQGTRLESSRALAKSLNISRTSVVTAFDRLIADGFVEARRGSGVYVAYRGPKRILEGSSPCNADVERIPFALGWASDVFPVEIWNRLQARVWRRTPDLILTQGDRAGYRGLRSAIATHVALTRGILCSPEQVIITTSIPAAIHLAIQALGLTESAFWVEDPGCRASIAALPQSDVEILPIDVDQEGMKVESAMLTAPYASGALVSPSRQAPTGAVLSDERQRQLTDWAEDRGAWIFEDDFNWDGDGVPSSARPIALFAPRRTVYLNSFNNILFPGLRVAYLIAPQQVVDQFAAIRGSEGDVNTANQIILSDFIEDGHLDKHLRRLQIVNAERREALAECVETELCEWLSPHDSLGGYYICSLSRFREDEAVAACREAGIVLHGMSEHRIHPVRRHEVILGFSQFQPAMLQNAAGRLRRLFDSVSTTRAWELA